MQQELEGLEAAGRGLEGQLDGLWGSLRQMADHPLNKQRLYVTDADVMALPPIRPTDQVVAVLAPQGTTLEVPEPDQGAEQGARRYRCAAALLESWLAAWLAVGAAGLMTAHSCCRDVWLPLARQLRMWCHLCPSGQ